MIKIDGNYTDFRDDSDPNYPWGKAVSASSPQSVDGTPWRAAFFNDLIGTRQAIFKEAYGDKQEEEPSNVPDNANNSDILNAIKRIIRISLAPVSVILRVGTILAAGGAEEHDGYLLSCNGAIKNVSDYPQLAECSVCQKLNNGTFRLPDLREVVLVGAGTNGTLPIAAHDVFGVGQFKDDQVQSHEHSYWRSNDQNGRAQAYEASYYNVDGFTQQTSACTARNGSTTRTKQYGVNWYIVAKPIF